MSTAETKCDKWRRDTSQLGFRWALEHVPTRRMGTTESPSHCFGELLSPLRALNSTRSARGRFIEQAHLYLNGSRCPATVTAKLNDCAFRQVTRIDPCNRRRASSSRMGIIESFPASNRM